MIYLCGVLIILAPFMWWLVGNLLQKWAWENNTFIGLNVSCVFGCIAQIVMCGGEMSHLTHNI